MSRRLSIMFIYLLCFSHFYPIIFAMFTLTARIIIESLALIKSLPKKQCTVQCHNVADCFKQHQRSGCGQMGLFRSRLPSFGHQ